MGFIRKKLQVIKNDSFLLLSLKIDFALIFLHLYQFYDSGFLIQPEIRLIFCLIFPVVAILFERLGIYIFFYIYSNYLALTMNFQNYTAFIIIVIITMMIPKMKYFCLITYSIDVIIVATIHDKTPVHIAIHVLNCIMLYYAINFLLKPTVHIKKLDLTCDEIIIIEELLKGKQQKEIEQFSQNTVTNKLKNARNRNNIPSTDELMQKYKSTRLSS